MDVAIPKPGETFCGEDGTTSTILPDFYDPNYEPPRDELEEYARCIGIDPDKEPDLLSIALEGLRAPLPSGWRACETEVEDEESGDLKKEVYYFNFETGDSLWDHPMDEVFREKVRLERAKRQAGGSTKGSAVGGLAGAATAFAKNTAPTATDTKRVNPGTTKTIANALFGNNSSHSTTMAQEAGANQSRLGALSLADNTNGGRGFLDVSDVLASANSSGIGHGSVLGGQRSFGQSALPGSPVTGGTPRGPVTMKDVEASLRKRIEDEFAPHAREEELRRDREVIEERARLERELNAVKQDLDRAWNAENNKTDAERLAEVDEEAKKIEEGWTQRLADERKRVQELENQISAKHEEIKKAKEQSVDVIKKELAAKNEAEVTAQRDKMMRDVDEELAKKERERAEILDELRRKGEQTVATARSRLEADHKKQQEVKATYAAKLRSSAEAEVKRLEKELAEQEAKLRAVRASTATTKATEATPSTPTSASGMSIEQLTAALSAVEAETRAVETQHKERLAKLDVEYTVKTDSLRSQIKRKEKENLEHSNASFVTSASGPSSAASPSISREQSTTAADTASQRQLQEQQQKQLKELEATLKQALEDAKTKYSEETEALVRKAKAAAAQGAPPTTTTLPNEAAAATANDSVNDSTNSTLSLAVHEQRAKDAANTRHILSLKQLESKHEQMVRQIREKHHKALTAAKRVDPRSAANYAKDMAARKRAWLTANPAPQAELPELPPVPKMVSLMGDMPAVEPPTEEEQQAYLQQRVAEMKASLDEEEEAAKASLVQKKQKELDTLREQYRAEQLEAVTARLNRYREELAAADAGAAEPVVARSASTSAPAAAIPAADLAKLRALEEERAKLQKELESARQSMTAARSAFDKDNAALQARIGAAQRDLDSARATSRTAVTTAASSHPNTPLNSAPKKASVVFEPDFETYIAKDEASAAESALKEKYQGELSRLKALIAQERTLYESAVKQLTEAREKQLPPPAPTAMNAASASTPINRSVVGPDDGTGRGAAPLFTGRGTPAQTAALTPGSARHTPRTSFGAPLFSSHMSYAGNGSLNASSIYPGSVAPYFSPHHQRVPEFLSDDADGEDAGVGPSGRASGLLEPNPIPPPTDPRAVVPPEDFGFPRDEAHEARLRNIQLALRARRSSLRSRQARLESLREEWREDMAACRAAKDRAQARVLKQAKQRLEAQARELNDAVLETKKAGLQLKQQIARYRAYLAGGPPAVERYDVMSLLEEVANKTAVLEQALLDPPHEARDQRLDRSRVRSASAHGPSSRPAVAVSGGRSHSHGR